MLEWILFLGNIYFKNIFPFFKKINTIIVIEELAKFDASVSVMVDVQNSLVSTCIRKWGTPEQHKKYLLGLSRKHLGFISIIKYLNY